MEVEMKNVQSNFNITSWAKVAHQVNQLLNLAVVGQPSGKVSGASVRYGSLLANRWNRSRLEEALAEA
jgi:hypothetical protein